MKSRENKKVNKKSPKGLLAKLKQKTKVTKFKFKKSKKPNLNPSNLQKGAMVTIGILTFLTFFLSNLQIFFWLKSDWLVSTVLPAVVTELTNEQRSQFSQQPLVRSELLDQAAKLKAEDMAKNSYFAHHSPDGISPWYWFQKVGYTYAFAGENLAVHFNDSKMVVDAWMNSPTHKANIIKNEYTEIGIGTAKGVYEGYDTVFVVQLFGTPAKTTTQNQGASISLNTNTETGFEDKKPEKTEVLGVSSEEEGGEVRAETEKEIIENKLEEETERKNEGKTEKEEKPVFIAGIDNSKNDNSFFEEITEKNSNLENEVVFEEPKTFETVEVADEMVVSETEKTADLSINNIPSDKKEPVFLDTISVASGLEAATENDFEEKLSINKKEGSNLFGFLVNPRQILALIYSILGILTAFALIFSIILGYKKRNFAEIGYGVGLLLVMGGLFFMQYILTGNVLIV